MQASWSRSSTSSSLLNMSGMGISLVCRDNFGQHLVRAKAKIKSGEDDLAKLSKGEAMFLQQTLSESLFQGGARPLSRVILGATGLKRLRSSVLNSGNNLLTTNGNQMALSPKYGNALSPKYHSLPNLSSSCSSLTPSKQR